MTTPIIVPMTVSTSNVRIGMTVSVAYSVVSGDWYDGEYSVTPGETEQILYTLEKTMRNNVTVAPIPSNWGKITYNGSVITVS